MDPHETAPARTHPKATRTVFLAIGSFLVAGLVVYLVFGRGAEPPPVIVGDSLMIRGREIYLERCVSCHGATGHGDGPLARNLTGPAPRNLAQEPWKYGDRPEQVLAVLADGVKDAQMPGWAGTYSPEELKAVAAYVYYIAGHPVPDILRAR